VVRPAACTVHGWKKKEQIPAEEKESSRLELLVCLGKEMLLWLLLVGVKASGQGGGCWLCCRRCCWSPGGRGGDFTEEREREVVHLSREMVLWLLEVGMMARS
jgi:hypothetical protein